MLKDGSGSLESTPEIIPFGAGIPHRTRSLVDFIPLNDSDALLKLFQEKETKSQCPPRTDYGQLW